MSARLLNPDGHELQERVEKWATHSDDKKKVIPYEGSSTDPCVQQKQKNLSFQKKEKFKAL